MSQLADKTFVLSAAAQTDPGHKRHNNEDYVGYTIPKDHTVLLNYGALFVVCDGVGGGSAGEVASEHAVKTVLRAYYQTPVEDSPEDRLSSAIQEANADIYNLNQEHSERREMATTVVAAVIIGQRLIVAHAGDSRAYFVRKGIAQQLTEDHSLVAEMVRSGDITAEQARVHPMRNRITRSLGLDEDVTVDINTYSVQLYDSLVLCTDGLSGSVREEDIAKITNMPSTARAAKHLVALAAARDGKDNITALVVNLIPTQLARQDELETQLPRSRQMKKRLPVPAIAGIIAAVLVTSIAGFVGIKAARDNTSRIEMYGVLTKEARATITSDHTQTTVASTADADAQKTATSIKKTLSPLAPEAKVTVSPTIKTKTTISPTTGAEATPVAVALPGKIVYQHKSLDGTRKIYIMNADGSGQKLLTDDAFDNQSPAWSPDGKLIAFASNRDENVEIYVMNADGTNKKRLTYDPAEDNYPAWSPDNTRIAFASFRDGNAEIYVINVDGSGLRRLTENNAEDNFPTWSPINDQIAFSTDRDGNWEIYVMNADGSALKNLTNDPNRDWSPAWSVDGQKIAFSSSRGFGGLLANIYVMKADGSDQNALTDTKAKNYSPNWSPDGSYIAFSSDQTGTVEIYVIKADGTEKENPIPNAEGGYPSWSR